jgi:hypothetical protein
VGCCKAQQQNKQNQLQQQQQQHHGFFGRKGWIRLPGLGSSHPSKGKVWSLCACTYVVRFAWRVSPCLSLIQDDQKLSVHLMIAVQKHAKIFQTVSITYHDNVVRIRDNRRRLCKSSVSKCLETGGEHFEY